MTFRNTKSEKNDNIFIGIDQSMVHTGITVLSRNEILISEGFSTSPDLSFEERILSIKSFLFKIIKEFNIEETSIAVEGLAFNRNKTNNSAMLFGLFTIIITELCKENYRYSIISPTALKKIATGNGRADKEDMVNEIEIEDIEYLLKLSKIKCKTSKKFEDIADSYWLAKAKQYELS